ncbi:BTAD domain-containing putative transcriptional regulator [Nonomuraea sp. NPDC049637]|uniref:AfsR/SARP family transcriptional regulator n=1 Tax=Nonomuraea sp. NPDC049637 TaxID=3154356 RepID=UPI003444EE59
MEFRLLGQLEALIDGRPLGLEGTRQQTVLAYLLLHPCQTVVSDRLLSALYGETPPLTARTQLQIVISSLRRLFAAGKQSNSIQTKPHGYLLKTDPSRLDSHQFGDLVQRARVTRDAGRIEEAISLYRKGLAMWRGPVLCGISSPEVQAAAAHLAELRVTANEECIELALTQGRHHEVVGELAALVKEHPLRERLHGQLMLALYRSGRQAEALQSYRAVRELMINELGIEPNERLQQLETAILTCDAGISLSGEHSGQSIRLARSAPRLLPPDIADFTGREPQTRDIEQILLSSTVVSASRAVPIVVISGMPGVGKSALAVHVSHRLAEHFADGCLFADLHGVESRRLSPMQVLERFLRALGVPGTEIPDEMEERASLYRRLLGDRRVLVTLDDAGGESHVLPLLPGTPGSAVLITSRSRLAALPGVHHLELELFDVEQALRLLSRIAGDERINSDMSSAKAVAELCGNLPLALRIVGARLSARQHWSVEQLRNRLENESRRLDELNHAGLGIRATISLIYEGVSEDARRLFRRLAIFDTPQFSGWVVIALLDVPPMESEDLLDELVDAQLIQPLTVGEGISGLYRFHDLIKVFAREKLAAHESPGDREGLLRRVLGALLALAEEAHIRLYGGPFVQIHSKAARWPLPKEIVDGLMAKPLHWFERERSSLVHGVRQAAQAGFTDLCWDLALSSVTLFESRMYLDDWRETHQVALEAARQAGDLRGQAATLYSTGSLYIHEQRFPEARHELEAAARTFRQCGDERGVALAVRNIAFLDRVAGRYEAAEARYIEGLEVFRRVEDGIAIAYVLQGLAHLKLELGNPAEAEQLLTEAIALARGANSPRVEAQVLHRIGEVWLSLDDPARAVKAFEQALVHVRSLADRVGEAYNLHGLGLALLRLSLHHEAREALGEGRRLARLSAERLAEARILLGMGELARAEGDSTLAAAYYREALDLADRIGAAALHARATALLEDSGRNVEARSATR